MMKNEANKTYDIGEVVKSDVYLEYVELEEKLEQCTELEDGINDKLSELVPYMDLKMHKVSRLVYILEEVGIVESDSKMFENMMEYLYDDLLNMEQEYSAVERTYSRNSSLFQYCPINGLDYFDLYPIDRRSYADVSFLSALDYNATEEQLALINEVLGYKQFTVDREVLESFIEYNEHEDKYELESDLVDDTESLIDDIMQELEELDEDYLYQIKVLQEYIEEVKDNQLELVKCELENIKCNSDMIDLELGKINRVDDEELRKVLVELATDF